MFIYIFKLLAKLVFYLHSKKKSNCNRINSELFSKKSFNHTKFANYWLNN
jgi:hypothetical protein